MRKTVPQRSARSYYLVKALDWVEKFGLILVRSDQMTVTLREVTKEDLPIFFEHQLDAEATRMAAFPSRDRDAFMAHWARIMSKETNETGILNTILADGTVAGNVVHWDAAGEPNIRDWLGRTHWGR